MRKPKVLTTVRLTETAHRLLDRLVDKLGLNQTGVLETAIRRLAKQEGVHVDEGKEAE